MNALILGGGGREHAIAWKVADSPLIERVFVAPGNAGTAGDAGMENVVLDASDADAIASFCAVQGVELVVIGPEAPLVAGMADALRDRDLLVVGPGAEGARLEASKAHCKEVMHAAGVPTARYARVRSVAEVDAFVDSFDGAALVVKADGLAAGKGVIVCEDVATARDEAVRMLEERTFGEASETIVLEERLHGIETSYIVLTDGTNYVPMPTSQDHKRLLDGDEGPNTGGMGAYSPAPFVDDATRNAIEQQVIEPMLAELRRRGVAYRGFLYAGVMLTERGPKVLEFNVRLGDPETQALMTALEADLVPALLACARGDLADVATLGPQRASAVIVLAAEGYPAAPKKGATIEGLEAAAAKPNTRVFHAGTRLEQGQAVVSGGRVLGVTAWGDSPEQAIDRAYDAAAVISWSGMQRRSDIGKAIR